MKNKQKGFTLVELLAVIIVLAIIMIIAIPAVLGSLNKSRKQTFFEYAQNIRLKAEQQYIQDSGIGLNLERTDCYVYDIKNDIGLGDTGAFDGWAKVKRERVSSGAKAAIVSIKSTDIIQYVRTCTTDEGNTCTPNDIYFVPEGSKSIDVTKSIKKGQKVCVNYQIANGEVLKTIDMGCKTYSQANEVLDRYKYSVEITLTNKQYSVQDVLFSENMSQEEFYVEIDKFREAHKGTINPLAITAPSCTASSGSDQKGTTSLKTTIGSLSTTTTRATSQGEASTTTTRATSQGETSTTTTRATSQGETSTLPTRDTTYGSTTTINVQDTSLLLNNLVVSGHDIKFNPLTFYYDISVPYTTTNLTVIATPNVTDESVNVQISGQNDLSVGLNVIVTEVYNKTNGKRAYYRINVRRYDSTDTPTTSTSTTTNQTNPRPGGLPDPTLEESDASLKALSVSGYPNLQFDPNVYEYTLVTNGESEIYPYYKPNSKIATVTVSGNIGVTDGSKILIIVKSQNGFYTKTYTINIKENKRTSTGTKVIRGIAIGLSVLLIAVLIIYSVMKNSKKTIKDNNINDPTRQASNNIVTPTPMNNVNSFQNINQTSDKTNQNTELQTPYDNNNQGTFQ